MRTFIGIEFSKEIKDRILQVQKIIKDNSVRGRWKCVDNFHLTLKFLDETNEKQIIKITEAMQNDIPNFERFSLFTGPLGYFKGRECLRVVYLGIKDSENKLLEIFNAVDRSCSENGFKKEERKYTPHVTIAQDVTLLTDFENIKSYAKDLPSLEFLVEEISIFKSEQVGGKRIYTVIKSVRLGNTI